MEENKAEACPTYETSIEILSKYDLPFPNPFDDPERYLLIESKDFVDGIQPGDFDLFLSEKWTTSFGNSISCRVEQYFEDNEEELTKALAFKREAGIDNVLSLIDYYEATYGSKEARSPFEL